MHCFFSTPSHLFFCHCCLRLVQVLVQIIFNFIILSTHFHEASFSCATLILNLFTLNYYQVSNPKTLYFIYVCWCNTLLTKIFWEIERMIEMFGTVEENEHIIIKCIHIIIIIQQVKTFLNKSFEIVLLKQYEWLVSYSENL